MSYDLIFWKQRPELVMDASTIYEVLGEDKRVQGLEDLPVENIVSTTLESFNNATRTTRDQIFWEQHAGGGFTMGWSDQYFYVNCTNNMSKEDMNRLIDIGITYDCSLYDPQTGERFA